MLFWTMLEIISKVLKANPKVKFLIENVKMKKEFESYITTHTERVLGKVNKYLINSSLVSAQKRNRYYWTNITNIKLPEDKGILLKDIILTNKEPIRYSSLSRVSGIVHTEISNNRKALPLTASDYNSKSKVLVIEEKYYLSKKMIEGLRNGNTAFKGRFKPHKLEDKSYCLTARYYKQGRTDPYIEDIRGIRRLTPIECERLQTIPDNYTEIIEKGKQLISDTQRYKMLGNGWTIDIITHLLKNMED